MTSKSVSMTRPELAGFLQTLYRQKATGSLVGIDGSGGSLVVSVKDGEVVGLSSKTTAGALAIDQFRSLTHCKGQFRAGMVLRTDAGLPPVQELLGALAPATRDVAAGGPAEPASNQANVMCETIKTEAKKLFGPAAGLFVEERLAASGSLANSDDLRRLLHSVSADMGEPQLASQLIAKVLGATGLEQRGGSRAGG